MAYRDDIAAMQLQKQRQEFRLQKQREDLAVDYNQAVAGREESLRNLEEVERQAALTNDPDEQAALKDQWHYYDAELQRCEADMHRLNPPQPQYHPKDVRLMNLNRPYFNKYGERGAQVASAVHQHVTQRVGITQNHPQYEEFMRSGMELYGKDSGCPYDRNDEVLTPDEACKISGVRPQVYNAMVRRVRGGR